MEPDAPEAQDRYELLSRQVADLRARIERLEASAAGTAPLPLVSPLVSPGHRGPVAAFNISNLTLAGRTLLAWGGAYLLRALTDGGMLSARLGAAVGLLYAAAFLVLAHRAACTGARQSALFHGIASTTIAFPLIWETTASLHFLAPAAGALALLAFSIACLWVAWRHDLAILGWTSTLAAIATAFALLIQTGRPAPIVAALFGLGVATELLAFDDRWRGLRWPGAAALDLALLLLANVAVHPDSRPEGYALPPLGAVIAAELFLPVLYLSSVAARTLVRKRLVASFGILQGSVSLIVGLGGAARVLEFHGSSIAAVGALALALSGAAYAVAFVFSSWHEGRNRNYHFYASVGLALALPGAAVALQSGALAPVWIAFGLLAVAVGSRRRQLTLEVHGVVYLLAASFASGLLGVAASGLWRSTSDGRNALGPAVIVCSLAAFASYALLATGAQRRQRSNAERAAAGVSAALVLFVLAGLSSLALARILGRGHAAPDEGFLAAARTGTLAAVAVLAAATSRGLRLPELGWLVYPILAGGGLKLVLEDLPHGRPATLFLSLAFYGAALILAPRLLGSQKR